MERVFIYWNDVDSHRTGAAREHSAVNSTPAMGRASQGARCDDAKRRPTLGCVGLVGLGNVGLHYAARLLEASDAVYVHDRDRDKVEAAVELGAVAARSSCGVTEAAGTVVLALPSPEAVEAEVLGDRGVLATRHDRRLVIDLSTIDPPTARRVHAEVARAGHDYVEAPMSGGAPGGAGEAGARAGTVTFMAGGDAHALERARPLFAVLGSHVIHVGPAGSGSTVKLVSNLIAGLNMAVMAEGFALGAAAGLSHKLLLEVFRHTDARSYTMFEEFGPRLRARDYEGGFAVDLMHKDHRLAGELGRGLGVALPFNALALEVYERCRSRGQGRKSHAVVVEVLADAAGVALRARAR